MGIDAVFKSLADRVINSQPATQAVALPAQAADPHAVREFNLAMAGTPPVEGAPPAGTPEAGRIDGMVHFSGDIEAGTRTGTGTRLESGALPPADGPAAADGVTPEKWVGSVLDIFQKESLSHTDLFRVQVLSSIAKVEITRNSSITKSIDDGMNTILKSQI